MGFTCGIVGLPNVGKSTIFNALTSAKAASANFPFCTIEPNTGMVPVPDERLSKLAELAKSQKIIPTQMEFVDIAGLIKGASQGEGLGNQFLGHIRSVDAIAHVVRCFSDENVIHVDGDVNPVRDVETIDTELLLSDLETITKQIDKVAKLTKNGDKEATLQVAIGTELKDWIGAGKPARTFSKVNEAQELLPWYSQLLSSKKVIFVANVNEEQLVEFDGESTSESVKQLKEYCESLGTGCIPICGSIESELAELDADERLEFLQDLGVSESGLDRLTQVGYSSLDLITYFTIGPKEARAWTIMRDTLAPQAAGKIHTDFEKGFIRAEVIASADYLEAGSELAVKEKGKLRVEGKEYVVQDGDVMHFRFNV